MNDVSQILAALGSGDPEAADKLLPLVYDELRRLARTRLSRERPGQTLEATALVHEAYVRLVGSEPADSNWENRGHFFAAAAEAMRRILVERARRKGRLKHGGGRARVPLDDLHQPLALSADSEADAHADQLLALDEALEKLAAEDAQAAKLVQLRYFAGLTMEQAAEALGVSPRKAFYIWSYARAWLLRAIADQDDVDGG
ncbi:MAG: ECF-type sigma factor [Pirellulales bacterium]